jgi:hypothetical protein
MDINQIYIAIPTKSGYKITKASKVIDIENFNVIQSDPDNYYLERKLEYKKISVEKIGKYDFKNCKINYCSLNNAIINLSSINKLLIKVYEIINDKNQIIKNSKINILPVVNLSKGFENLKKLNISYSKPDNNIGIYEIVNQCESNNIKLDVKIILQNQSCIRIAL